MYEKAVKWMRSWKLNPEMEDEADYAAAAYP